MVCVERGSAQGRPLHGEVGKWGHEPRSVSVVGTPSRSPGPQSSAPTVYAAPTSCSASAGARCPLPGWARPVAAVQTPFSGTRNCPPGASKPAARGWARAQGGRSRWQGPLRSQGRDPGKRCPEVPGGQPGTSTRGSRPHCPQRPRKAYDADGRHGRSETRWPPGTLRESCVCVRGGWGSMKPLPVRGPLG